MAKSAKAHKRNPSSLTSEDDCPVEIAIEVIGGRWKCPIIHHLTSGSKRFSELQKLVYGASQRMLTKHLRELEEHGIINREVFEEVPPKTEYSLTEKGRTLEPVMWVLHDWSVANMGVKPKR